MPTVDFKVDGAAHRIMHRGREHRRGGRFGGARLEMHAELAQNVLRVGEHVHQMRDRRALIAADIGDAGLQQRLGDREDAFAAEISPSPSRRSSTSLAKERSAMVCILQRICYSIHLYVKYVNETPLHCGRKLAYGARKTKVKSMLKLPRFKAAAVQASPVYLDAGATIDKAVSLIREAAKNGAKLVAFPEVFVPGYPYWNWITDPVTGGAWFEKLVKASVLVPGPEIDAIRRAARETGTYVVIGVNERSPVSLGATLQHVGLHRSGRRLLGKHRKLVPTWAEKLTWTGGDGSSLRVYDTEIGRLGGLACGENTNTLARFALLAQGELVHIASYISLPVAPPDYDMAEAIKLRAMAHSFEGKIFTIVSCSTVSEEIIAAMEAVVPDARARLQRKSARSPV